MMTELGVAQTGTLCTDSSAAKGTVSRVGSGRLKHVATNVFWVQEKAARGELKYLKVGRLHNPADLLTHHWDAKTGEAFFAKLGLYSLGR